MAPITSYSKHSSKKAERIKLIEHAQKLGFNLNEISQRDKERSHLLHEPKFRIMTTDPISGRDVEDYMSHCSLLDGNLTVYFETEEHRNEYRNMQFNHPNQCLPYPATDDDRGG